MAPCVVGGGDVNLRLRLDVGLPLHASLRRQGSVGNMLTCLSQSSIQKVPSRMEDSPGNVQAQRATCLAGDFWSSRRAGHSSDPRPRIRKGFKLIPNDDPKTADPKGASTQQFGLLDLDDSNSCN